MNKKRIIRFTLLASLTILLIGGAFAAYLFNMPQRNVQAAKTDYVLQASQIVNEYLKNGKQADQKYLGSEGDSKILEITGTVNKISEDFNKNKVITLKSNSDKAGVSCTFTSETNSHISTTNVGQNIHVKGVIRAGASFDKDLDMYEDVIMEKCDIVSK